MELRFTPQEEPQLAQIASFRAAVRKGVAQADRGEFIDELEMDARLEQMLRS